MIKKMSQMRQIVEKYHLFLFLVMKENLFFIGLNPKIKDKDRMDITVKTIIKNNSKNGPLLTINNLTMVEFYSIVFPTVIKR